MLIVFGMMLMNNMHHVVFALAHLGRDFLILDQFVELKLGGLILQMICHFDFVLLFVLYHLLKYGY